MTFKNCNLLAALRIPDAGGGAKCRHDPFAVATERRGTQDVGVFKDGDIRIPDAGGLVFRRRYHSLAVVAERRGLHWAVMTRLPSALNAEVNTGPRWPFRTAISLPLSASQMRAVLS